MLYGWLDYLCLWFGGIMIGIIGTVVLLLVSTNAMIKNKCKLEAFMLVYMLVVFLGAGYTLGLK